MKVAGARLSINTIEVSTHSASKYHDSTKGKEMTSVLGNPSLGGHGSLAVLGTGGDMSPPMQKSPRSRRRNHPRKLVVFVALGLVLAVFAGTLVSAAPDPVEEVVAVASGDALIDAEAAAGSWHWTRTHYRFNYWETRAIADWWPTNCGTACWATRLVSRIPKIGWITTLTYYYMMFYYRSGARYALSQGRCLNVTVAGGFGWAGDCG